mgnify:FL=1
MEINRRVYDPGTMYRPPDELVYISANGREWEVSASLGVLGMSKRKDAHKLGVFYSLWALAQCGEPNPDREVRLAAIDLFGGHDVCGIKMGIGEFKRIVRENS